MDKIFQSAQNCDPYFASKNHNRRVCSIDSQLDTIEQLREQLAKANEELSQFNYHISHDLVAPISSARGLLNLVQEDLAAGVTEELTELVTDAQNQLLRLDNLVADLMSLARAGVHEQNIGEFDLRKLLDDIVASLSMHALELETSVTLQADQPILTGDRVRVQQILANLISNARKFVDPNELAPEITLSCENTASGVFLRVADNGIGIDPSIAGKLFRLFSRGTSQHEGHGLGLYIVAKHVSRLGGSVRVVSFSKPTLFEVFLPAVTLESDVNRYHAVSSNDASMNSGNSGSELA